MMATKHDALAMMEWSNWHNAVMQGEMPMPEQVYERRSTETTSAQVHNLYRTITHLNRVLGRLPKSEALAKLEHAQALMAEAYSELVDELR
jgi:hypothetical protein